MFEDEYRSMTSKPLNVEYLMMDASVLLPPTGTPLTGIDFVKRLPCGGVEKTRRVTHTHTETHLLPCGGVEKTRRVTHTHTH
uniref:CLEC16A/TT9 C-terminal domain-containing protein n=1 Tax=Oncorhynchus tshawytscha TaxID=74940 RepID=A0AAZ3PAR8_ONCTS